MSLYSGVMELTLWTILGASIISLFVGYLTGIFGIGGGFLITPILIIMLAVKPQVAVATTIAMILFTSSFGLWKRRGTGTVDGKLAAVISIGTIPGVFAGLWLLHRLASLPSVRILGREHPAGDYIILWSFVSLLLAVAAFLIWDYRRSGGQPPARRAGLLAKTLIEPRIRFESLEHKKHPLVPLVLLGVPIGMLTGLLGLGGGIVMLPALNYLVGQRAVKAVGTSLLIVWLSVLVATIFNLASGHIDLPLAAILAVFGIVGTHYGTELGLKLHGPRLRLYFVAIVLTAAALIAAKIIHLTLS
jgi:uncharacterized membrane protein YfcA